MELLNTPRTDFLLEPSLEALHAESNTWMQDVKFWEDELTFFYTLFRQKELGKVFPSKELATIQQQLIALRGESLNVAKAGLENHQRTLASLLTVGSAGADDDYRNAHRAVHHMLVRLQANIKDFKRSAFAFVGQHSTYS